MRAISAAPISPRVARVSGTWTVIASGAREELLERARGSTPMEWPPARRSRTGREPMTVISMRPGAVGDRPADLAEADDAQRLAAQLEARELARASTRPGASRRPRPPTCRASAKSSASVCSAAAIVLPVGALTTMMPARVAASQVDVVDADAGPADDDQAGAGGDHLGVDLDLAAHDERVVVGQDARQISSRDRPSALVDLVVRAEELEALGGERLDDQDPACRSPRPARRARAGEAARCWAAATAAPGSDRRARARSRPPRGRRSQRRMSSSVDGAEVADPEDPARSACPGRRRAPGRGA